MDYRIKLHLADGRKVYFSKKGAVSIVSEDHLAVLPNMEANILKSAYSPDLSMFADIAMFGKSPFVKVLRIEKEDAATEGDPEAFIQGGSRPFATQN